MDAFQHVNNALYFRYFETGRIAYIEAMGVEDFMTGRSVSPILASICCNFRFPVTYPDTLKMGIRVSELGADRFLMEHRAVSTRHQRLAAEGDGLIVTFDYVAQRKTAMPPSVRDAILALEASVNHAPAEMKR
ncbi:MAG: acyl-CoA thioesterase [Caldilineaceae bacterium]|nr:acyl-CoA thioesterase [Caldilineaceae bacterium]